jgi:tetratricopeptide (TPR) repeat protein
VFLRYSLALELEGEGRWEEGLEILEDLARGTPPYVPAFHMAARHLVARGRIEEARRALREGIDAARAQGEAHAAGEMSELLMSLGEFGEG